MAPPATAATARPPTFRRGFYLHTSWEFAYPFAVRSWQREDFTRFFALLQQLDFNLVMFWPLTEAMPAPLSPADRAELETMRRLADDAHACGLDFWLTFCANATARPEIASRSFKSRHLYPFRIDVRLDDPIAKAAYLAHRAEILKILNNADAYVTIDGDPGGYPGAKPRQFNEVLEADRAVLDRTGTHPPAQQIVPWVWQGWGSDWGKHGVWGEPIEPLAGPELEAVKLLPEPWTLLPGRHIREGRGNGRLIFEMTERAGLTGKSVLLCYEIIEYEPTPPAVVLQFDDIRRVLRQEAPLLAKSRGVMGNAQQPLLALPNLFFFARGTSNPAYLNRSDGEILRDLAQFLGGDPAVLLPAWQCLQRDLATLPADLPARLERSALTAAAAKLLPGGAARYLQILAAFVRARLAVLQACHRPPVSESAAVDALHQATAALTAWWGVHRYVFTGENGTDFQWEFTHPELLAPLQAWMKQLTYPQDVIILHAARRLSATGNLSENQALRLLRALG
ncbi:MAG: hypothetical protein IPN11_05895 [Opitutaceae bacterium]|nr:hypothetical protein [Opitutaceae bacterium]